MNYKTCAVPMCKSTTIKCPEKLFIHVPKCPSRRKQWLLLARRDPKFTSDKSIIFFCEDHFDLPNDMENYMQYHLMGSVAQIRMVPGCIPTKFACHQSDTKTKTSANKEQSSKPKTRKEMDPEETEEQLEESSMVTENFEENSSESTDDQLEIDTSVCRVCLASNNTRMLNVNNIHLVAMYEKLTDTKLHTEGAAENGLPSTLCYVCLRQLQRCHKFSRVAINSNRILLDLLQNGTEITQNTIIMQSQRMHNMGVTVTKNISINNNSGNESTAETIKEEQVDVKDEETSGIDEIDIEEMILEMPNENVEIRSTGDIIKEELLDVEEEETNGTDEIDIEQIKLEMPDVNVEIGNITNNTEPFLNNTAYEHNYVIPKFCCDVCNMKIFTEYELSRHLKLHNRDKSHSCKRCDKVFNCKRNLTSHMRVHTEEKPYSCKTCDKAFKHKSNIKTHMLIHTGVKPHSCSWCGKAFTEKYYLAKHMRIHTGVRPYSCNSCDKAFTLKNTLKNHMLAHTGVKEYSCNRCDKAFYQKSGLASHMLKHTGEKPYSCSSCGKAFTANSTLTKHMRFVHNGEKNESLPNL